MKRSPRWLQRLLITRLIVMALILAQIVLIISTIVHYKQLLWLTNLMTAISFFIAVHLLTRRDEKSAIKFSLIFLIFLFPLFGGALYVVFQYQTAAIGFRNRISKVEQTTKDAYQASEERLQRAKEALCNESKQIHYLQKVPGFPVCDCTETTYFSDGNEMLTSLLREIDDAKKYIFLEFFIIEEGYFWDAILQALKEKAKVGVDVRIIYDDIGCLLRLPSDYPQTLSQYGIRCKVFNRFRPFLTSLQNNRDHRKIIVIDGKVAYTGGINLADEYLNKRVLFGKWKDNAVLLRGLGAWSFTVMFLQMWKFLDGSSESISDFYPSGSNIEAPQSGWVQPYCDSPMDKEHVSEQVYLNIIEQARHYLYITTPYLIIDGSLVSTLKLCAKSGVDVRIITPSKPDKKIVHFTTRSYYRELLHAGVKIYEYGDGFIHSKMLLADDRIASVGTVNLDFRSMYYHFECGTCLYGTPSLIDIKEDFLSTLTHCYEVTEESCKTNFVVRILQDVCRIFAPLM